MQYFLWFGQFFFTYAMIIILFKLWKKEGLLMWCVLSVVLANIQVVKLISLFGLDATLGNILYLSSFFVTDVLSELYGKKEAQKGMYLSLFASFLYLFYGCLAVLFKPLEFDITGHSALAVLFRFSPRVIFASFICYWLSQTVDISLYHKFTEKSMKIWQKNFWSTQVSQLIDSFLFVGIAFFGAFEGSLREQIPVVLQIGFSTFFIKTFVNLIDIPFLYLIKHMHDSENLNV